MRARCALALLLAALAAPAAAHVQLVYPPARSGTAGAPDLVNQKLRPCGIAGRSPDVTVLEPGTTITVLFDEVIDHPGEFRVAFDANGDDDLAPPVWDGTTWSTPPGVLLLAEHVPDLAPGTTRGAIPVTLPAVPCTRCTLQLVQIMTDKPPFVGDDDFYFMCADLVLAVPTTCGDGVVEGIEACDDGNASNEDGCLVTCAAATCGDGFVRAGVEACDDGNVVDGDGCSATCAIEPPRATATAAGGGCSSAGPGALGLSLAALALAPRRRRR